MQTFVHLNIISNNIEFMRTNFMDKENPSLYNIFEADEEKKALYENFYCFYLELLCWFG